MLGIALLLGALYIGYKAVSSSGSETSGGAPPPRDEPRALDTRTDASRGKSDSDLMREDFKELPPELREYVYGVLLDPTLTAEEIEQGAETLLQGCKKDEQDQVHALVAGNESFDKLIASADKSWCYPTAAARLLKIAKKKAASVDAAISLATSEKTAKESPVTGPAGGVFQRQIALPSEMSTARKKATLKEILDREVADLKREAPEMGADIEKLVSVYLTWNLDATLAAYGDYEWIRSFADSIDDYYKDKNFNLLSGALRNLADIVQAGEDLRDEINARYDEARKKQIEDDRAEADWSSLWNFDDKVFQPDFRYVARSVKKVPDEGGGYHLEWSSGDINVGAFSNFITNLVKRVAGKIALTGGSSSDGSSGGFEADGFTLPGILKTLEPIAKFAMSEVLKRLGGSLPQSGDELIEWASG